MFLWSVSTSPSPPLSESLPTQSRSFRPRDRCSEVGGGFLGGLGREKGGLQNLEEGEGLTSVERKDELSLALLVRDVGKGRRGGERKETSPFREVKVRFPPQCTE